MEVFAMIVIWAVIVVGVATNPELKDTTGEDLSPNTNVEQVEEWENVEEN